MTFAENMPEYGFSMTRITPHKIESFLRLYRRIRVKKTHQHSAYFRHTD